MQPNSGAGASNGYRPVAAALVLLFVSPLACLNAAEPAGEFLQGLRERGYYDEAIDYLDRLESSRQAPSEFLLRLPLERASLFVDAARNQADSARREELLDQAEAVLSRYLADGRSGSLERSASKQLAFLMQARGKLKVDSARRSQPPDAELLRQARQHYESAKSLFANRETRAAQELAKMPKLLDPKTQAAEIAEREELRTTVGESRLFAAGVTEEMAETEATGSPGFKNALRSAADAYGKIHNDYRRRIIGQYALLYQARCLARLGDHIKALVHCTELLDYSDPPPEFRDLQTQALVVAAQCWLDPSQKQHRQVIERVTRWVDQADRSELQQQHGLTLRYLLAQAYVALASELASAGGPTNEISRAQANARRAAEFVARFTSEHQQGARKLLADLGADDHRGGSSSPETFDEARRAGQQAFDAARSAADRLAELEKSASQEKNASQVKNASARSQAEAELAKAAKQRDEAYSAAARLLGLALHLAAEEGAPSPARIEEVNGVRHQLAFAKYQLGEWYDAAVIGSFLAERYPQTAGARPAAKLALLSYLKLYRQAGAQNEIEKRRLAEVCERIARLWPDQPEAAEALATLIPFAIEKGQLDQARDFLARIPEQSSLRTNAELKVGQALWAAYVEGVQARDAASPQGSQTDPAGDEPPSEEKLHEFKSQAEQILTAGLARMERQATPDASAPTARLFLAQILVDTGRADQAIAMLEDSAGGALTLIEKKDPAASGGFAIDAYQTALRAYLSRLPSATPAEADRLMAKARQVMHALQQQAGDEQKRKLIERYYALARDLQRQLAIAPPEQRPLLSKGFETFLDQVGKETSDLNTLYWVGETFFGMGEKFSDPGARPGPDATRYFASAVAAYQRVLDKGDKDPGWLPDEMRSHVLVRLALAHRRGMAFKKAIDIHHQLLSGSEEANRLLDIQMEAARTYQDWARHGKAELYTLAMFGARPDSQKRNVIWGWGRLSQATAGKDRFSPEFHEARYNLARCRYEFAMRQPASKRQPLLEAAKKDITVTQRLYPEMGGQAWRRRYDELLKLIQRQLGEAADGLAAAGAGASRQEK